MAIPSWTVEMWAPNASTISDTFSRPDSTDLGREEGPQRLAWLTSTGAAKIASNTLLSTGAGSSLVYMNAGSKNVIVDVEPIAPTSQAFYVVVMRTDDNNMVVVGSQFYDSHAYTIWKRIAGAWTELDFTSGAPVNNRTWRVITAGQSVQMWADGTLVASGTLTAGDVTALGTGVGGYWYLTEAVGGADSFTVTPQPAALDTFSRADSASLGDEEANGITWSETTGNSEIVGGAIASTGVGTSIALLADLGQDIDATFTSEPPSSDATYLVTHYKDASNYVLIGREPGLGYSWRIWKAIGGGWTALAGVAGPVTTDTELRVVTEGTAITLFASGRQVLSAQLAKTDPAALGDDVGFYWWQTTTASFDNLTVRTGTSQWQNITADVIGDVTTSRGRRDPFGEIPPGRINLSLASRWRRYDPSHVSSPYYGAMRPGTPIRIRGDSTSIAHARVREWPVTYGHGNDPIRVDLSLTDDLEDLASLEMPSPWAVRAAKIDDLDPRAWYRFTETSGGVMHDSSPNYLDGSHFEVGFVLLGIPALAFGGGTGIQGRSAGSLIAHESDPALAPGGPAETYLGAANRYALASQNQWAMDCWVELSDDTGGVIWSHRHNDLRQVRLFVGSTTQPSGWVGEVIVELTNGLNAWPTGVTQLHSGTSIVDGRPHHVMVQRQHFTLRLYVDGEQVDSASVSAWGHWSEGTGGATDNRIGWNSYQTGGGGTQNVFPGRIDEVAFWGSNTAQFPMAAVAAARYTLGALGYGIGSTVSTALDAFADDVLPGFFTTRSWDALTETVGPEAYDGLSALDWMRQLAAVHQHGRVFVDAAGVLTVSDANAAYSSAADLLITDDAAVSGGVRAEAPLRTDWDHGYVRNRVEITVAGSGETVVAEDTTSISLYGPSTLTRTAATETAAQARALADALLAERKDPIGRIEQVTIDGQPLTTGQRDTILALELGDPVAVRTHPDLVGDPVIFVSRVEGIQHRFRGDHVWQITLWLSPDDVVAPATIPVGTIPSTAVVFEPTLSLGSTTQAISTGLGGTVQSQVFNPTLSLAGNVVSIISTDNPETVMNANPAGTRYEFAASTTWSGYTLTPKDGDQLVGLGTGATRATLSGTGATEPWAITGDASNVLIANLIIEDYNGVPIWGPNSVRHQGVIHAVAVDAGNNPVSYAADWTIRDCLIDNGEGAGITPGDRFEIADNVIQYCGMNGISAGDVFGGYWHHNDITGCNHATLSPRTGDYNYTAGAEYAQSWNAAGIKVAVINARGYYNADFTAINPGAVDTTNRLRIEHNHIHDNEGVGLWVDVASHGVDIVDNLIEDNRTTRTHGEYIGVFLEISRDITCTANLIRGHATDASTWITPTELYVWSCENVDVSGNYIDTRHYVAGGRNVFTLNGRFRNEWAGEEWLLANVSVDDNEIYYNDTTPRCGVGNDDTPPSGAGTEYFQTAGLTFLANKWLTATPTNGGCWWQFAPPFSTQAWSVWTTAQPTGAGSTWTTHSNTWPSWSL